MYKMDSTAESELTTITLSSPSRSPLRPVYFVQSPSHESTPAQSPARSPPPPPQSHSYNYFTAATSGHRHSREYSSSSPSRYSSFLPPFAATAGGDPSRISPDDDKAWTRIIEEESLLDAYDEEERGRGGASRRFYVLAFVVSFLVLFSMFTLVLWGTSLRQKPVIAMKSIRFENFVIQAGTDASMVPTDLSTLNSTLRFTYRNTGSFFGVHVSSTPVKLYYYQLAMATGSIDNFYQRKKSERSLSVTVAGNQIPLYGGGAGLSSNPRKSSSSVEYVNMTLSFRMRSRAYVLGKLVQPKFHSNVQCLVTMDLSNLSKTISLGNSCHYN